MLQIKLEIQPFKTTTSLVPSRDEGIQLFTD